VFTIGQAVTLETVNVPLVNSAGKPDSGITRWKENVAEDIMHAFVLRLFFVTETSSISSKPVGELGTSVASVHTSFVSSK